MTGQNNNTYIQLILALMFVKTQTELIVMKNLEK